MFGGGRTLWKNAIFITWHHITSHQGYVPSVWFTSVEVVLGHMAEVVFARFLHCGYSIPHPHPILFALEGSCYNQTHFSSRESCSTSLRVKYFHKIFEILISEKFASSSLCIRYLYVSVWTHGFLFYFILFILAMPKACRSSWAGDQWRILNLLGHQGTPFFFLAGYSFYTLHYTPILFYLFLLFKLFQLWPLWTLSVDSCVPLTDPIILCMCVYLFIYLFILWQGGG